jgi:hypothetical protein
VLIAACAIVVACADPRYVRDVSEAEDAMTAVEQNRAERVREHLDETSGLGEDVVAVTVDDQHVTVWIDPRAQTDHDPEYVWTIVADAVAVREVAGLRTMTVKNGRTNSPVSLPLPSIARPGDRWGVGDDLVLTVPRGWSGSGPQSYGRPLQVGTGEESLWLSPDIDGEPNLQGDEVYFEVVRSRTELRESLAWRASGSDEDDGPAVADSVPWVTFDWQGRTVEARAGGPSPTRPSWRLGVDVVIPIEPQGFVLVRAGTDQARWGAAGADDPQAAAEDILRRFGFANAR